MKPHLLIPLCAFYAATAWGGGAERHDLGNGASLEIRDGKVHVDTKGVAGSISQSTSSHTDSSGNTVTKVVIERNGQRTTREVRLSPDGKVTITDPGDSAEPPSPIAPAPTGGWMGVHTIPLSAALRSQLNLREGEGIVVEFIASGGPAASAGISANDILLTLDGASITSVEAFRESLKKTTPGQKVVISHMQRGQTKKSTVTLGDRLPEAPPGDLVKSEADRLLKEMQARHGTHRRTIVVDENGHTKIIEGDAGSDDPFDLLLRNPNVPAEIKAQLRRTQEAMKQEQSPGPKSKQK